MWRLALTVALLCAVLLHNPAMAQYIDPACKMEKRGQIDLTPSVESDVIIATGDVCQLEVINIVVETHEGRRIYEHSINHIELYLGTSGRTRAEDFEWTLGELTHGPTTTLPRLDHISIDYELRIEADDYERLREAEAPAYTFHHYYAGLSYVVYDSDAGRAVLALRYGT